MAQLFQPPTTNDLPRVTADTRGVPYLLMRHYSLLPRGRSVVKTAGVWTTTDTPDTTGLVEGTDLFFGGHTYTVTDTVAAALTTDGFGAYLSAAPTDISHTWARMETATWDGWDGYEWGGIP